MSDYGSVGMRSSAPSYMANSDVLDMFLTDPLQYPSLSGPRANIYFCKPPNPLILSNQISSR